MISVRETEKLSLQQIERFLAAAKEFIRSAARENLLGFHVVLHGDLLNDGGMPYP